MSNQNNKTDPFINQIIFNKYQIKKRLGKGSFGSIYLVLYNNKLYAMKLENKKKGFYILDKEVILKKVTNILLSGWLMKFYLWFNHKSAF